MCATFLIFTVRAIYVGAINWEVFVDTFLIDNDAELTVTSGFAESALDHTQMCCRSCIGWCDKTAGC